MVIDAFVFESDQPRSRVVCSVRIATDEEINLLNTEIRKQGNARKFPIILRHILMHVAQSGGTISVAQFEALSKELAELNVSHPRLHKFKRDLALVLKAAHKLQRPIVF